MNSDFKDLLRIFNAAKVRYLVVGGYAVMKYTEPRYTKDLDLWIEAIAEERPGRVQGAEGIRGSAGKPHRGGFSKEGFFFQMGRPPGGSRS